MTDPHQQVGDAIKNIADLPLWIIVVLAMASGLSGEMLRASSITDMTWKQIVCRILMRFGAAGLTGLATFMVAMSYDMHPYTAAAICIFTAVLGGDVTSSLIERFAKNKIDKMTEKNE